MTKPVLEQLIEKWFYHKDSGSEPDSSPEMARVQQVKQRYQADLLAMPNVVGVGIGFKLVNGVPGDQLAIVVSVVRKISRDELLPQAVLPEMLDGVPVDVIETGELAAF